MKKIELNSLKEAGEERLLLLKAKAANGYQMIRMPRTGSTATMHTFQASPVFKKFVMLGCCSFSDMPFAWGAAHNSVLNFPVDICPGDSRFYETLQTSRRVRGFGTGEKSWITTFNVRADEKPEYDRDKLTFQVIRNPFDWMTSIYAWDFMKTRERLGIHSFHQYVNYCLGMTSDVWADQVQHAFPWPMMKRCFFQAFDNDDNCKVDLFVRFEHLQEGLADLFALGDHELPPIPYHKAKVTKWSRDNTFETYRDKFFKTPDLIELLSSAYAWDLENFKYDYNGPEDSVASLIEGK